MRKISVIFLLLAMSVCLGAGFSACKDKSDDTPSTQEQVIQNLIPEKLTLHVGDTYQFQAINGKYYDTFSSANADIVSVNSNGSAVAKAEGKTNVILVVNKKNHSCEVTVLPNVALPKEENNIYGIGVENVYEVQLNTSFDIVPIAYKNGVAVEGELTWTLPENDVITNEKIGNTLRVTGSKIGFVKLNVAYEEYVATVIVKVFDDSSYLNKPSNQRIENGKLLWDGVDGAIGYMVSTNLGKTWINVGTATEYGIAEEVHMLNVDVMAIAEKESEKINSKTFTQRSQSVTSQIASLSNVTANNADSSYTVSVSNQAKWGKQAFYLYSNDSANAALLADGVDCHKALSNLAYTMSVKSNVNSTLYFISESANGKVNYSTFEIQAGTWTQVGYKLNGYEKYVMVAATGDFLCKDASVTLNVAEYEYSTVAQDIVNALEILSLPEIDSSERKEKEELVKSNFKYLKADEYAEFLDIYKEELESVLAPTFIDGKLSMSKLEVGYGTVNMAINEDGRYIAEGDACSIKLVYAVPSTVKYDTLLPETAPAYDSYVWKIYSEIEGDIVIGSKVATMAKGWNEVTLTYAELTAAKEIYTNGGTLYLGSLKGVADVEVDLLPTFIDGKLDTSKLTVGYGSVSMTINDKSTYIASGDLYSVKLVYSTPATVKYDALLPETAPAYDSYVWKIYSEIEGDIVIGSKTVTMAKGWNEVTLTYAELTAAKEIYTNGGTLYLGSLIGVSNA